jgi:hypothetical protein
MVAVDLDHNMVTPKDVRKDPDASQSVRVEESYVSDEWSCTSTRRLASWTTASV